MKISLIQADLVWENKVENLKLFDGLLKEVPSDSDMVVLPEMFSTGFSMQPILHAENMSGDTVVWMQEQSIKLSKPIVGSLIIEDAGNFYNRLLVAFPDGNLKTYDKKHLFAFAGENKEYTAGDERLIIEYKDWKIAFFICYDLRFPAWMRNNKLQYDLAIVVANWPEPRRHHWKSLLVARAIENQSYMIGLNRVGIDGKGINHSGDSAVLDPQGNYVAELIPHKQVVETVRLDKVVLDDYRKKFPAYLDADDFELK